MGCCEGCDDSGLLIGPPGTNGIDGNPGIPGVDGIDGIGYAIFVENIPPGIQCPCSGYKVEIGPDASGDGIPDTITSTIYVCNGCDGADANIPVGFIQMFDGDCTLPGPNFDATGLGIGTLTSFAMCNGANSTPDLRAQFIVGLYPGGDIDGDYSTIGSTGGEKKHSLLIGEILRHTHSGGTLTTNTTGGHVHGINWGNDAGNGALVDGTNANPATPVNTLSAGAHNHTITSGVSENGTAAGLKSPADGHENRPNYFTLCFIKKIV